MSLVTRQYAHLGETLKHNLQINEQQTGELQENRM